MQVTTDKGRQQDRALHWMHPLRHRNKAQEQQPRDGSFTTLAGCGNGNKDLGAGLW
jgi:hypothetical protein